MWKFLWQKMADHYWDKMCATSLSEQPKQKDIYRILYLDCIEVKFRKYDNWLKVATDVILYPIRERMK